jgi:hypothetical protein
MLAEINTSFIVNGMAMREHKDSDLERKGIPVAKRASEVALNHGRPADSVTDADVNWAKRELKPMKLSSPAPASKEAWTS